MLRHFLLLSLAASTAIGLFCYEYNDYDDVVDTAHHRKFCTAVYDVADGIGSFGGGERHSFRVPNVGNMTKGNDCVFQHVNSNLKGVPSSDMWMCYCFENMCNYPFTWKEFVSRGHTLKPMYAKELEDR